MVIPFPELISWKTADIPSFGRDEEGCEDSEVKRDAGGGGGGPGALDVDGLGGAETGAFPVALQTGPKG